MEARELQGVRHIGGTHRVGKVVLVCEHQQDRVPQLVLIQHPVELFTALVDAVAIVGVEEKLFGYEFFGNKYTSEGCSLCGPSKRHNAAAPPRTGALMGGPGLSEEKKE